MSLAASDIGQPSRLLRCWRLVHKLARAAMLCLVGYCVLCVLGAIPINTNYRPGADGIEIFIRGDLVHTEFVLPTVTPAIDWRRHFPRRHFAAADPATDHIGLSWGDRDFFIEIPTWQDLKASTTAKAMLWPTETVMHVQYMDPPNDPTFRRLIISRDQYVALCDFVLASFAEPPHTARVRYEEAYHDSDAFYPARGKYHLFNTCNNWTNRGLKAMRIRTGIWTPMAPVLMWHVSAVAEARQAD